MSFIPAFRTLSRANSMYVYLNTLAFEPDFLLEQRSTLIPETLLDEYQ